MAMRGGWQTRADINDAAGFTRLFGHRPGDSSPGETGAPSNSRVYTRIIPLIASVAFNPDPDSTTTIQFLSDANLPVSINRRLQRQPLQMSAQRIYPSWPNL